MMQVFEPLCFSVSVARRSCKWRPKRPPPWLCSLSGSRFIPTSRLARFGITQSQKRAPQASSACGCRKRGRQRKMSDRVAFPLSGPPLMHKGRTGSTARIRRRAPSESQGLPPGHKQAGLQNPQLLQVIKQRRWTPQTREESSAKLGLYFRVIKILASRSHGL
ncbi:hypothetical protein LY76DRAFT_110582 [Colletotrichum caudatum]|nr:hypothetical protein LY76DRAFT_110582 [Colletotrichum caudatum]